MASRWTRLAGRLGRPLPLAPLLAAAVTLVLGSLATGAATANMPPWTDPNDVPLPSWVRSVAPKKDELPIFVEPGRSQRRGTVPRGSRVPLFATRRGPSCVGRWLNVGPLAWVCSDLATFTEDPVQPSALLSAEAGDGLPYRYFFVGKEGAFAWDRLDRAGEDQPDQELEPGFAIAGVEERSSLGERWVRTSKGRFVAMRDLAAAHPSGFSGESIPAGSGESGARLDFAWVLVDRVTARAKPSAGAKAAGVRVRFERVPIAEVRGAGSSAWLRISKDGEPEAWLLAREVARPTIAARPPEARDDERWIDIELASQTLVAYEGDRPVFATLVSTGRGPQGSDTATPLGINRIWVKLHTSTMDNLERRDDPEASDKEEENRLYSLDDVPYVQFFNKAVALHGVFWHRNFGRVQSHGCVNLAPKDARFLFGFTGPHLPRGWSAALPTALDPGTLVRVR